MKSLKIAVVILLLACLGLCVALVLRLKDRDQTVAQNETNIVALRKEVQQKSGNLEEQIQVNMQLTNEIKTREAEVVAYSNKLVQVSSEKEKIQADAKAAAQAAQTELAKRDSKIGELEGQRDDLTKKMLALNSSISSLEKQITDTERKLSVSEGDREFLLKELKRLQTEKAELERQYNSLADLKSQVRKLRDELAVARRIDFFRYGLFGGTRGAEKLLQRTAPTTTKSNAFSLNVELKREGGARILPPAESPGAGPTNPPAPAVPK